MLFKKIQVIIKRLLKSKNDSVEIMIHNPKIYKDDISKTLSYKISEIDREIIICSKNLLEAKKIQIHSSIVKPNGLLSSIQNRWITTATNKSAQWHQNEIRRLYQQRFELQNKLDKAEGKFWIKRVLRWLSYLLIITVCIIAIILLILGLMMSFYLLPLWIIMIISYIYIKNSRK
tara:strand:+ start:121 stop:645 length:525 start_codon:yes stop_codon:yes gene_type:complete